MNLPAFALSPAQSGVSCEPTAATGGDLTQPRDSREPQQSFLGRTRAFFRRKPVVAWGATAAASAAVVAVVVVLAVSGRSEAASVLFKCSVYDSDASLRFTFDGKVTRKEADEGCGSLARQFSSAKGYWRAGRPPLPRSEPKLACALSLPAKETVSGTVYIEANPESFSSFGTELCGYLSHEGWTEALAPTGGPWIREWRAEQARQTAIEDRTQEEWEVKQAEKERLEREYHNCETKAEEKLESQREAIQAESEALEKGSLEHIYEVQEAAEGRELEAEERELRSIGRCQHNVGETGDAKSEAGAVEPDAGAEYR